MGSRFGQVKDLSLNGLGPSFHPLFRNPHLATIISSYWPRRLDETRFPVEARLHTTEPGVQVLIHTQSPASSRGDVVLIHGLEGSSLSPYMRSLSQALLEAGYATHRMNIRTCGGTEFLCGTLYHGGLTTDLFAFLMLLDQQRRTPIHLVGFSLGGNMALKLAGELGPDAGRLLASVSAICTPLDLGACAHRLAEPGNRLYDYVFTRSMKRRLLLRRKVLEDRIDWDLVPRLRTLLELDDRVTAPFFGFRDGAHYYGTQSARLFLSRIETPTLVIHAKDDPMIPISTYSDPALRENPRIRVVLTDHGGHMGFVSKGLPRIWIDGAVVSWIGRSGN